MPVVPNLAQSVTAKLSRDNYILWKAQVVPILCGANLMGFLDGSTPCPVRMVAESGSDVQVPNPEYLRWMQTDQLLISGMLSTLTIELLGSVTMLKSSSEVWSTLTTMFSAASTSKVLQLRMQLSKLSKGELSAPAYFQKVKALTDTMSAIGKPLDDEEIIAYLLSGLDEEYDSLVDSIAARTDSPSLSEVYSLFIGHDTWVQMGSSAA